MAAVLRRRLLAALVCGWAFAVLLLDVVSLCLRRRLFARAALAWGSFPRSLILGSVRRLVLCVASLEPRSVLRQLSILVLLCLRLVQASPMMTMLILMVMVIVVWTLSLSVWLKFSGEGAFVRCVFALRVLVRAGTGSRRAWSLLRNLLIRVIGFRCSVLAVSFV